MDRGYISQLIAFEDKRFYDHSGVDYLAVIRAVGQAVWNGRIVSGGSTLTMQVARLLEDGSTGAWEGKLRQTRVALALEKTLTKKEILELYLHLAPFGGNLEGLRAATLTYFRKEPRRLTVAEAALLVSLPQSPERRRPDRYPEVATTARDRVLQRLSDKGVLVVEDAQAALHEVAPATKHPFPVRAAHLAERYLALYPGKNRHQLTIDRTVQTAVEAAVKSYVSKKHERLSAAVIILNHNTGEVLVSVGSPDYLDERRDGFLDMTLAKRSPGSTLKPLIYGLAFESGRAHPETVIDDRPMDFEGYAPQNFDKQFHGAITLRRALQMSLNIPAVALLNEVGPQNLVSRMKRAGVKPKIPGKGKPGLAIGLGGMGVSLQELVATYGAIARGGDPVRIAYTPDEMSEFETAPVLGELSAWYVSDVLAGISPPDNAPSDVLAYKTGTSYGHRDAWAIGFDGRHTIGVWLGRPDGAAMPGELGRELAAPLMFESFAALTSEPETMPPPPPEALTVSNAELPSQLRVFHPRGQHLAKNEPRISFPPDGARIDIQADTEGAFLALKVQQGAPPFTWLANGEPVDVASYERQLIWQPDGPGYAVISVVDALGQSQKVGVYLE